MWAPAGPQNLDVVGARVQFSIRDTKNRPCGALQDPKGLYKAFGALAVPEMSGVASYEMIAGGLPPHLLHPLPPYANLP